MDENRPERRHIEAVDEMYQLRGQVTTSYAQIEFFLADLGQKAGSLEEYRHLRDLWAHRLSGRVKAFGRLLARPGRLAIYRAEATALVDRFQRFEEQRNFLVHGVTIIEIDARGGWTAVIRRYVVANGLPEQRLWRAPRAELLRIGAEIGELAHAFVTLCQRIYLAEGLQQPD